MGKIQISDIELQDIQKEIIEESKRNLNKYGQAAIHLVTSGGKSYIISSLIAYLKDKKLKETGSKSFNAIVISTPSGCNNLKSLYSEDKVLSKVITYVYLTKLQRDEKFADTLDIKQVDLIVFDEAHTALANNRFKGVKYLLSKYPNADRIAATATTNRYDRKSVFGGLTPKLTENVDYFDRGLKYAIDNDLICDFTYKVCDVQLIRNYCKALESMKGYSTIYSKYAEIYKSATTLINEYTDNVFSKIADSIKSDLKQYKYSPEDGNRWFVFFNRVDEIKQNKENVRNMFINAYNDSNVTFNILEYHYGSSDEDCADMLSVINSQPKKNTVDIIMTCLKGAESLHPVNTVGIIINRRTGSEIALTQMFGRALMLKNISNDRKLIYDIVDNRETLDITQSIYNGTDKPDDRRIASIVKELSKADNTEKVISKLKDSYGEDSDIQILDDDMAEVIEKFKSMKEMLERLTDVFTIKNIIDDNKSSYSYTNPVVILREFDKRAGKNSNMEQKLKSLQKLFIQGYFGNYIVGETEMTDQYKLVDSELGKYLYMTPDATKGSNMKIEELMEIAEEVKKYDYDYRNRISKTSKLKDKIQNIRELNLHGKLSESYQVFCKRNKIDINGIYANLIQEAFVDVDMSLPIMQQMYKEYKDVVRALTKVKFEYSNNSMIYENGLSALAKEHIFSTKYVYIKNGMCASNAINITFKGTLRKLKKLCTPESYLSMTKFIHTYNKISRILESDKDCNESILNNITLIDEYSIINVVIQNEQDKLDDYSLNVLNELGVSVLNTYRTFNINKLVEVIPFGIIYNEFVKNNNTKYYSRLNGYIKMGLPLHFQKLLENKKCKQAINTVEQDKLLSNPVNEDIEKIISSMYTVDKSSTDLIKKALKNKEIDQRALFKYAVPKQAYNKNKVIVDKAITCTWDSLDLNSKQIITGIFKNSLASRIVKNLISENLIPDEQMGMASAIANIS